MTTYTHFTPSKPRRIHAHCSPTLSRKMVATCRRHQITFGNAHTVLSQIASSRVLHRRYLRGDISEEEWEWRKREPFNIYGPVNLRPYLDKGWFERGGATVITMAISHFFFKLPFMPAVPYARSEQHLFPLNNGSPPFSSLLSHGRFLLRCNSIKQQSKQFLHHPLFLELVDAQLPGLVAQRKMERKLWEQFQNGQLQEAAVPIGAMEEDGAVFHNGGSSIGNVSAILYYLF